MALGSRTLAWKTSKTSTLLSAVLLRYHNMSNSNVAITPLDATGLVSFINASPTRNVERSEKEWCLTDKPQHFMRWKRQGENSLKLGSKR